MDICTAQPKMNNPKKAGFSSRPVWEQELASAAQGEGELGQDN